MSQESQQQVTRAQKSEIMRNVIILPALTVIVFFRSNIGLRLLHPGWMFLMGCIVWLIAHMAQNPARQAMNDFMIYFAYGIPLLSAVHRLKAWWFTRKGKPWHSYSTGISPFEKITPRSWHHTRLLKCVLDPLAVALLGCFVMRYVSMPFGGWLIFSAFCLAFFEMTLHERATDRKLDLADGLIVAEDAAQTAEHFDGSAASATPPAASSGDVSTGLGADLRNRVKHGTS